MIFYIIFTLIICYLLYHQYYFQRYSTLPSGPMPWPIVGNLLQFNFKAPEKTILKWKQRYGGVFTVWLPLPNVIFADYDLIKDTFVKQGEVFAGRPSMYLMKVLFKGNYGLVFSSNDFYKSQRNFSLHVLRDFGLGRNVLQDAIIDQAKKAIAELHRTNGASMQVRNIVTTAVGNIINRLVFGYVHEYDDPKLHRFRQLQDELFVALSGPAILLLELWSSLRYIDRFIDIGYQTTKNVTKNLFEYLQAEVDEHRATIDYEAPARDYTDAYLIEINRRKRNGTVDEFTDWQMLTAISDLFSAGLVTTVTTLRFAINYLLVHPDVQAKIHAEIDASIGRDREISMDDQKLLPYLCAYIQEVQRHANIIPLNLQHALLDDVECNGHVIPKGTTVTAQTPTIHIDPVYFDDPDCFRPERFIDANSGKFIKSDKVLPFSIGKRSCLGESIARMELFLFIASFVQKCEFHVPNGEQRPTRINVTAVGIRDPLPFNCSVIARN